MNVAALGVSSFILSIIACWRSGGKKDFERARLELNRKVDALAVRQNELVEGLEKALGEAYQNSRLRLHAARERLRQVTEKSIEDLAKQVHLAHQHVEALARRLEEAATSVKDTALATAQRIEQAIGSRVRRFEARTDLLFAKSEITFAKTAATTKNFSRAEELLEAASDTLRSVQEILGEDRAYDQLLQEMRLALRDAITAARTQAEDVREKTEQVLTDTDRLISALESHEAKAQSESKEIKD